MLVASELVVFRLQGFQLLWISTEHRRPAFDCLISRSGIPLQVRTVIRTSRVRIPVEQLRIRLVSLPQNFLNSIHVFSIISVIGKRVVYDEACVGCVVGVITFIIVGVKSRESREDCGFAGRGRLVL